MLENYLNGVLDECQLMCFEKMDDERMISSLSKIGNAEVAKLAALAKKIGKENLASRIETLSKETTARKIAALKKVVIVDTSYPFLTPLTQFDVVTDSNGRQLSVIAAPSGSMLGRYGDL